MITIGILSDTHLAEPTELFRQLAADCFADASIIMHAGDLTDLSVLKVFGGKEVHAVHGNMCSFSACSVLPGKKTVEVGGFRIGLIHRAGYSYDFEELLLDEFDEVDCIIYGHTHRALCRRTAGVLYINPGSFLPASRYGTPGTYAILEVDETLRCRIHEVGPR